MDVYHVDVIDSDHPVFITIAYIPFVSVMDMINITYIASTVSY